MRTVSLTQQVTQRLLELIKRGNHVPGDKLPSENVLAKNLGVSRTIVREALAGLKNDDVVEAKQGKGIIIKDPQGRTAFRVSDVFDTLSKTEANHLYEMRAALESEAACLAATRLTPEHAIHIQEALQGLKDAVTQNQLGEKAHDLFNESIANASANPALVEFLMFLRTKLHKLSKELRLNTMMSAERAAVVFREHETIVSAILAKDPHSAKKAVLQHLQNAAKRAGLQIYT